jgi:chromosome segregation protein
VKLEKVVLNGFKSFADKTDFTFNNQITAIVGPNGCGKSNVVDAVKWVLGEQSVKSLRSGQMTDVIFSGSGGKKASGMAEVKLQFSDVAVPGGGVEELAITRRLYKSGDSEYLINDKVARLKDIRELLMDTGIGTRAYSIIEQGHVDQLVTANKIDRRGLFEEAAGISKFKSHKKEAERKLERTEQNLLRLADIVNEVQKQLRSIKVQAGKARNYVEYSQRLKELRVNYSLSEFHQFKTGIEKESEKLTDFEGKFSEIVAKVGRHDAQLSEMTSEIIETESHISRSDNSLIAIKGKIEQSKERIEYLRSRIEELVQRKSKATEQIQRVSEQNKVFEQEIAAKQTELDQSESVYAAKEQEISRLSEFVNEINFGCHEIESELDDEKSGIIDIVRKTAQLHNEIGSLNTHRDNLSGQKDRLSGRANVAQSELEDFLKEKIQYQRRLDEIGKILGELNGGLDEKRRQMEQLNSELGRKSDEIASRKEKRSALGSELAVLRDMEQKREGVNKTVKNVLRLVQTDNSFDYIDGIVADIIQAQPEYATAVESALEGISDAVVINSTSRFLEDERIKNILESRVNFICTDRIGCFSDSTDLSGFDFVIGRAVEFVSFESRFANAVWNLLGKTIIVESVDTAIELAGKLGKDFRFVTKDGQVLSNGFTLTAGAAGKSTGLISRKSRLKQIEDELAVLSVEISTLGGEFEKDTQENQHLARLCQNLRTSIYEANTEKTEANGKLSSLEQNIQRISREQPLIAGEIEMLQEQIAGSIEREYQSKQKLEELEQVRKERDAHIETLESQLQEEKIKIEEHNARLTELKIALGTIVEQRRSHRSQIASLQSQIQHARMTLESARNDLLGSDEQIEQAERNILASESEVSELFMEKEKAQKISSELNEKVQNIRAERQQIEAELKASRAAQSQAEENIYNVKLELNQLQVKRDDICQRVREELGMDLSEAYANYQHQDVDWNAVRAEIADLRGKIERLGNVNVDAIDEQKTLEERNEFLTKQVDDLNNSKSQLQQLIARINKESKEKFRITYEQIRENFQMLFRKLFGGGKADVVLENPDDILESGIEIIARPPGKELRSISLLSGGEKTMTAIALLFAVFKSKPSPFCILDEVDAALDEANNERFNLIVDEFKDISQFIIVTHSKRTMSIADVLFGVTMQTQGVSKKISVKFGEEIENAVA